MQRVSPLITPDELLSIRDKSNIVLIDARASKDAQEQYAEAHLEGTLFVDLNTQLARIKSDAANGGRHPLPTPYQFA